MKKQESSHNSQSEAIPTYERDFDLLFDTCKEFTMKSRSRLYLLWKTICHIYQLQIPGDFVECGVWRGGSSMMMALTLKALGQTDRNLYLYDMFRGTTKAVNQNESFDIKNTQPEFAAKQEDLNHSNIEEVRTNLLSTGYPEKRLHFVCGNVEETIPRITPLVIAMLRLDIDWYESSTHAFGYLYPHVSPQGAVIIDDFRHWKGARESVQDYLGVLMAMRIRYPNIGSERVALLEKMRSTIFRNK